MWPSVGNKQGWDPKIVHAEYIYEARKGEKARQVAPLNLDTRRTIEAEITNRTVDFIKRNASAGKPFYAYVSSDLTGPFCTSRREREFTRRTAGYAHQEVQSRTDRDDTASD